MSQSSHTRLSAPLLCRCVQGASDPVSLLDAPVESRPRSVGLIPPDLQPWEAGCLAWLSGGLPSGWSGQGQQAADFQDEIEISQNKATDNDTRNASCMARLHRVLMTMSEISCVC